MSDAKSSPEAKPQPPAPAPEPIKKRRGLRFVLLLVVPAIAAGAGLFAWLNGGRYITTDNAYVGAQKVLITPEVSGKVVAFGGDVAMVEIDEDDTGLRDVLGLG